MSMRSHIDIVTKALTEAAVPVISPQEARTRKLFGPVYHGSDSIETILAQGFDMNRAEEGRANGYPFQPYSPGGGLPAPVHHLGFGAYFTTVKAIAKSFNGDSTKGLREFWLDVPRLHEINFGSASTMMRWWYQNGYQPSDDILKRRDYREWTEQTRALTDTLSSQFDAVWFKGKGIRKLLDGDQICVYDPARIFVVDPKLATGIEVGSKVVHNQKHLHWVGRNDVYVDTIDHDSRFPGWTAYFKVFDHNNNEVPKDQAFQLHRIPPAGMVGTIVGVRACPPAYNGGRTEKFDVKWAKGGVMHGYFADELAPAPVATRKTAAKKAA